MANTCVGSEESFHLVTMYRSLCDVPTETSLSPRGLKLIAPTPTGCALSNVLILVHVETSKKASAPASRFTPTQMYFLSFVSAIADTGPSAKQNLVCRLRLAE